MIKLQLSNLFQINSGHGLTKNEIQEQSTKIEPYLQKIENRKQGFYKIIDDEEVGAEIKNYAQSVQGKFKHIVLLGIGGSALGPICLQQSLKHLFENELTDSTTPSLHVVDNIDPELIRATEDIIDYAQTLFLVVTKSGGTPETLSQYFYFRQQAENKNLEINQHFVFITDPQRGLLRQISARDNIKTFDIPENVGGRFSVLTSVGLLPAALIGIDIEQLLVGARRMRDNFLNKNFDQNLPFQLAIIQYLLGRKNKIMNVMWPYSQRLIRLSDWYRQLLAESIGKKVNERGDEVFVGLTPVHALGATDQHSQSQLYNEGPNDKFFIFLKVQNQGPALEIPNLEPAEEVVDYLQNVSFNKLIHTELAGTAQALTQNDRPSITLEMDEVNEATLGELLMLFQGATAFLGELYEINAFDQPGVELSKNLTKNLLKGKIK